MADQTKQNKLIALIFAFATQVPEEDLFREMLEGINQLCDDPFDSELLKQRINLVNEIIGFDEVSADIVGTNFTQLKNKRGMIVKVVNADGKMVIDTYFSYPSARGSGNLKVRPVDMLYTSIFRRLYHFGSSMVIFRTSVEILKNILQYAILNFLVDRKIVLQSILTSNIPVEVEEQLAYRVSSGRLQIKVEEHFQYFTTETILSLIGQIPQIREFVLKKRELEIKHFQLRTAQTLAIALSIALGIGMVQGFLALTQLDTRISFVSLFASMLIGIVINNTLGEVLLGVIIKDYKQRLRLGESSNGVEVNIMSNVLNFIMHFILGITIGLSIGQIFAMVFSFIFFVYPTNYLMNIMWSLKKEVIGINSGKIPMNRRYYANTPHTTVQRADMLPVTITIPIYLEENSIIFETLRQSLAAVRHYKRNIGKPANIVVSDDGLQRMLDNQCTKAHIEELIRAKKANDPTLTPLELQAVERIMFFRRHNIAFVARPTQGRAGRFKKGSNLNYTLRLAEYMAAGATDRIFQPPSDFTGGYAEGTIIIHDVMLLLDKDSGLNPKILAATIPEFVLDPKLVYTQHSTQPTNENDNYFARAMGYFTTNLFSNSLPNKALRGFLVPLVGHNAFLRKAFVVNSGFWAEDRVSEDYSKAIDAYRLGYHGKYIAYAGLDFSEYVSRMFSEETGKQLRYSFGIAEMLLNNSKDWVQHGVLNNLYKRQLKMYPRTRFFDIYDMLIYFCSYLNSAALIPTAILSSLFVGYSYNLWGGFISNLFTFSVIPMLYSWRMARIRGGTKNGFFMNSIILGMAFLGHTYAVLKGFLKFLVDPFLATPKPFDATSVDSLDYSFADGINILKKFYSTNKVYLVISIWFLLAGVRFLMFENEFIMVVITMVYILIVFPFILALLTPPLFAGTRRGQRRKQRRLEHRQARKVRMQRKQLARAAGKIGA